MSLDKSQLACYTQHTIGEYGNSGVKVRQSVTVHAAKAQVQAVPGVDVDLCQACRKCLARAVCRSKALLQIDLGDAPFVDVSRCYGCAACVLACPIGALKLN